MAIKQIKLMTAATDDNPADLLTKPNEEADRPLQHGVAATFEAEVEYWTPPLALVQSDDAADACLQLCAKYF